MCCLLCFAKLGCTSEMKMKVFWTFILHFTHLALTLHLKTHDECFRYYK